MRITELDTYSKKYAKIKNKYINKWSEMIEIQQQVLKRKHHKIIQHTVTSQQRKKEEERNLKQPNQKRSNLQMGTNQTRKKSQILNWVTYKTNKDWKHHKIIQHSHQPKKRERERKRKKKEISNS